MKTRALVIAAIVVALAGFLAWRFLRPMNIFVVDERFAWPVDTSQAPPALGNLRATECAACHREFHDEWQTSIHAQAWTDPYFQVDWRFDGSQHICRLCHTPLDRQLPEKVLGYRDADKWYPITAANPAFDPGLQHEGVTCAACHYRDGKVVGVLGTTGAPHPVEKLADPNQVCVRCHVVEGDRWDTFFRFPPCGTVAEIESTLAAAPVRPDAGRVPSSRTGKDPGSDGSLAGESGEMIARDARSLGCVECHMPLAKRPLVEGGVVRDTRRHLWRGGHDPGMVRHALTAAFAEVEPRKAGKRRFRLTLTNTGAAHYVPTGTPDRHLTVDLRAYDAHGAVLDEERDMVKRTVMWRPFIVDLRDTRLPRGQPRAYELEVAGDRAVTVEAEVRYHLLAESRRKRIGYGNTTPIHYEVFRKQIPLRRAGADAAQ